MLNECLVITAHQKTSSRLAFSLVELSIVLVILGLLVGGVLSGQSLIHAAQLRAVSTEYDRYTAAIYSFRDKYFALPGDMTNATSFWGDQATGTSACASGATPDGTPGTCNGDGDGFIGTGGSIVAEDFRAWQQLAFAGLIEGSYLGYLDAGGTKVTVGVNIPASKLTPAGWGLLYRNGASGVNYVWMQTGNFMLLGSENSNQLWGNVLNPADVWNIDTKIDDGIPITGRVLSGDGSGTNTCVTPYANIASSTPSTQVYNLASATVSCAIWFKM